MDFKFWNRVYAFNGKNGAGCGAMPSEINVGGEDILAAPAALRLIREGKDALWENYEPFLQKRGEYGDTYMFACQSPEAKIIVDAAVRAEEDGFVWYDLTIMPYRGEYPEFDSLILDLPLKTDVCRLMNFCSMEPETPINIKSSDYFPKDGVKLPFVPAFWVGYEKAGLGFYLESAKNMRPADEGTLIETITDGDVTTLRIHLLDTKPAYWCPPDAWGNHSAPLSISFGIQATPVREFVKPKDFERAMHGAIGNITDEVIDELPSIGVKYVIFHENWSDIQNYNCCYNSEEFKELVGRCHSKGIKVLVYFGYEISSLAPDFNRRFPEIGVKYTHEHYRNSYQRTPPQRDFVCCYNSSYAATMLEQVEAAIDGFGLDGIYTDGTFMPFPCANEIHGCGWRDENGKLHMSVPLLAYRDHVRRLAGLVHSKGGIIDAHQGGYCYAPLLSFADSYWDGEGVQEAYKSDIGGYFNFGTLRAQFTGKNWGVASQFIVYNSPEVTFENISGLLLVCGVLGRPYGIGNARTASKIWRELDGFGTDEAEFYPPWENNGEIISADPDVLTSCWIKASGDSGEKKALAVAFNRSKQLRRVKLTCLGKTVELDAPPQIPTFVHF